MKNISILGDSLSTYEGFNPSGYAVFYDSEMQIRNGLANVEDTWWAKLIHYLEGQLCVNNAFSGSKVTGLCFPAASSDERIRDLRTESIVPDIIIVYIGFNDFGNGIRIQRENSSESEMLFFETAYAKMIQRIKAYYPDSRIICGTLMRTNVVGHDEWVFPENYAGVELEDYNRFIRDFCRKKDILLADVGSEGFYYETIDGSHPTKEGHEAIFNRWKYCLGQIASLEYLDSH